MAMPGAGLGAVLVAVVLVVTVVTPFLTDMFADVTPRTNPTAFFLLLPTLAFAVLFWGMGLHWVYLMCEGISQKLWLKAKGLRFGKRRPKPGEGGDKGAGGGDTTKPPEVGGGEGGMFEGGMFKSGFLLGGKKPKGKPGTPQMV